MAGLQETLSPIPELDQSKMPAVDPKAAEAMFETLLGGGEKSLLELIDALAEKDDGSDYRVRFCLHNLAKVVSDPSRKKDRDVYVATLLSQLGGKRQASQQTFLVQQLQWIADQNALDKLAPLLGHPDAPLFDAVLAVTVAIGSASAPVLQNALAQAEGPRAESIRNAIAQLKLKDA